MIPLKEWQYKLLERISKENYTNYHIKEIEGDYYISFDDVFEVLDETENYRQYAEEKLSEVATEHDKRWYEENANSLQLSTIKALDETKEENDKLKLEVKGLKEKIESLLN